MKKKHRWAWSSRAKGAAGDASVICEPMIESKHYIFESLDLD